MRQTPNLFGFDWLGRNGLQSRALCCIHNFILNIDNHSSIEIHIRCKLRKIHIAFQRTQPQKVHFYNLPRGMRVTWYVKCCQWSRLCVIRTISTLLCNHFINIETGSLNILLNVLTTFHGTPHYLL